MRDNRKESRYYKCVIPFIIVHLFIAFSSAAFAEEPTADVASSTKRHQLTVGLGLPLVFYLDGEDVWGSSTDDELWIGDDLLWVTSPVMYRYRFSEFFGVNGGLMLAAFFNRHNDNLPAIGAGLRGGVRVYPLPDWLYLNFDITLGYPFFYSLLPCIGTEIPLNDSTYLFIESEVAITFLSDGYIGFWQPIVGLDFRF